MIHCNPFWTRTKRQFLFDVRFSKFVFASVHLCQLPNIETDKLGSFWFVYVWSV